VKVSSAGLTAQRIETGTSTLEPSQARADFKINTLRMLSRSFRAALLAVEQAAFVCRGATGAQDSDQRRE
jgi:hypothetical protein